jgi:hypothetical protein
MELSLEFFIAHQFDGCRVHIEKFIVQEEICNENS